MHLMVYSLFFLTYGILVQFWSEMTADLVINLTVEVSLWIQCYASCSARGQPGLRCTLLCCVVL